MKKILELIKKYKVYSILIAVVLVVCLGLAFYSMKGNTSPKSSVKTTTNKAVTNNKPNNPDVNNTAQNPTSNQSNVGQTPTQQPVSTVDHSTQVVQTTKSGKDTSYLEYYSKLIRSSMDFKISRQESIKINAIKAEENTKNNSSQETNAKNNSSQGTDTKNKSSNLPSIQDEAKPRTVNEKIVMTTDERDLLERLVEAEAGGEPPEGKNAVVTVVLNRLKSPEFSKTKTIHDVIYAKDQFTPISNGTINKKASSASKEAVKQVVDNGYRSFGENVTYFMNPKLAETLWISENKEEVTVIGEHHFYR